MRRLGNVELLRALAATWVVLTHASGWVSARGISHFASDFFSVGYVGVDLFFVISGFVITLSYVSRPVGFLNFMRARVLRIVPLYWFVTVITSLAAVAYLASGANSGAFSSMSPGWVLASLGFLSQPIFGISPVVYQGWTLELEMAFYLLFGTALFLARGKMGLIFLLLTGSLVFASALQLLPTIVLEFSLGIVIAFLYKRASSKPNAFSAFAASSMCLGLIGLWIALGAGYEEEWRFAALGIPSALLLLGAVKLPQLQTKWISSLGSASYGIYLWQVLTIPICAPLALIVFGAELSLIVVLIPLVATIVVGVLSDRYFDQPLRTWLGKKVPLAQKTRGN